MKNETKAILLSAFVFPGLGHLFIKKYYYGALLVSLALLALSFLIYVSVQRAYALIEQILADDSGLDLANFDLAALLEMVKMQSGVAQADLTTYVTMALLLIWALSVADLVRIACLKK